MRVILPCLIFTLITLLTSCGDRPAHYTQSGEALRSKNFEQLKHSWGAPLSQIREVNGTTRYFYKIVNPGPPPNRNTAIGVNVGGGSHPVIVDETQVTPTTPYAVCLLEVVVSKENHIISAKKRGECSNIAEGLE